MSDFPVCSGEMATRAFLKFGYMEDHQTDMHIVLWLPSGKRLTVPRHRELARRTLRSLIRESGITNEQFREHL